MAGTIIQFTDIDSFKLGNSLLKNSSQSTFGKSFEEVIETKAKEIASKTEDKTSEVLDTKGTKKKKEKFGNELPDISQILTRNDRADSHEIRNTYLLLDKFRKDRKSQEDEGSKGERQRTLNNANNVAGQALLQPTYERGQRRMSKSQVLNAWERMAPSLTEDITKKSVRIDIPMLNDIQALVLRLNPDKSVTASLLGSKEVGELIKQNKDKLDRNLRHHHLSLREFNTYQGELSFNTESGTTRKKKKPVKASSKKAESLFYVIAIHLSLDLILFLALINVHHQNWLQIFSYAR